MYHLEIIIREPVSTRVLLVDLSSGYFLEEALEQLFFSNPTLIASSSAILIRCPVWLDINKDETLSVNKMQEFKIIDSSADEHFGRFEGRPIYLIGSCQYDHWISPNVNETCVNDTLRLETHRVGGLFKLIRNTEIDRLIEIGQAIMPEIAHTHYLAPSGNTQAAFLRVGNIQFSQAALDAIFFWLLPSLKEIGAIITDTWSIASTALNISRRLSLYRNEKICCPVEMLSYYQAGRNQTAIEALKCIKRYNENAPSPNKNSKILFLMSAINTGGLLNSIRESLKAQGQETTSITFVTLFNLGDTRTDLRCLRDFSVAAGRGRFTSITGSKAKGKSLIQIDPRTYFPARYVDVLHTMRKRDVVSILRFAKSYANVPLFKVHKDDIGSDGSTKHHAIFVDTLALIKTEAFRNKLRAVVLELRPRPAVIVTPTHLAGQELAAIAMAVLAETGPRPHHISHPNLHTGSSERPESKGIKEIINKLNAQAQGLLILDDAYISGRRLIAYQTNLRSTEYCGVIHYLIGLARYDDPAVWRRDKSMLEQRMLDSPLYPQLNTVKAIEEVLLPDWDKKQCPWCEELRLYDKISKVREASAFSDYLLLRQKRLQDEVQLGLEDQLFLTNQGVEKLPLHPMSIFQPDIYTEAAFFASVASAMQNHRTSNYPNPLGPRRHPIATVLDHEEYLFKVYTEAFLRACFLRSAQPYEMIYTDVTRENSKSRRVEQMLASMLPTDFELGPEILLARAVGKFPNLDMTAESLLKASKAFGPSNVFRDMTEGELRDAAAPNKRREGDDEDF